MSKCFLSDIKINLGICMYVHVIWYNNINEFEIVNIKNVKISTTVHVKIFRRTNNAQFAKIQ